MKLSMVDRSGVLSKETRRLAEERVRAALARFSGRARRVSLVVEDVNGPRGGHDKACRLAVKLSGAGEVRVSDRDPNVGRCIGRVADRLAHAVGRTLARAGGKRRKQAISPWDQPVGQEDEYIMSPS
ncbi:MAG: hypothetical protein AAGA92_01855 [Planctomycetota bacterium]